MKPTRTIHEIIEDIWANQDREYNVRCLVRRLRRIDKEMAGEARVMFEARSIPDGDIGRFATELPGRLLRDFKGTMQLLRDPTFQDLLVNYPRRKQPFVKAIEYEDTVTSVWMVRDGRGQEMKPEDYLTAFSRFVRENPARVEAIQILMDRPQGWGTEALVELRQKLLTAPERFTVENLQKAHQISYHKALADIISMVKHAARDQEPLLTAEERVERTIRKVSFGKGLTSEQQAWLGRIREHMIVNLSIDRVDFDISPVLSRAGGWAPADRVFGGELKALIDSLNEAIAA
jgi:type I restriction enzyme R subunit